MKLGNVKLKLYGMLHGLPAGTDGLVKFEDIIVPRTFRRSTPNERKMKRARDAYEKNGFIDVPLVVERITNEKGQPTKYLLVDHYSRYLVLLEQQVDIAAVKYIL